MLIPARVHQLYEADSPLGQSPRHQAMMCERAAFLHVGPVHVKHMLRFVRNVGQFRDAGLHFVGHLVLRDARLNLRITELLVLQFVQLRQVIENPAANLASYASRIR